MTDRGAPNQNAEQPAPAVNGPVPDAELIQPSDVPSFVCVLPCTKPSVKYLDRLDGCANGIHVTREETKDPQVLNERMANAIMAKDAERVDGTTPDPCILCEGPSVPNQTSPVYYMESCLHYFHYGCLGNFPATDPSESWLYVSHCQMFSSRSLLWPKLFPTEAAKNEIFQLQKRCFGLDVSPQTTLHVYVSNGFPQIDFILNEKRVSLRQRRATPPPPQVNPDRSQVTVTHLAQVIQDLHLADQPRPFYLSDILPLEENAQYQAKYGPKPPLSEQEKCDKLMLQFQCPFEPASWWRQLISAEQCSKGEMCKFFHGWPEDTPAFIKERVKGRQLPSYLCLDSTRKVSALPSAVNSQIKSIVSELESLGYIVIASCAERLRLHPQDLARCSHGFHPTVHDLQDMDGFARKMAQQIMAPVVVPEQQHLVCAYCRQPAETNSTWIHMQNCIHFLHLHCFPLIERPNRKLVCPACQIPSIRTIAWPGPFHSDTVKQAIFGRQLSMFNLSNFQSDTQLSIVQVANQITVDYGGPNVVTIDGATAQDKSTIWLD